VFILWSFSHSEPTVRSPSNVHSRFTLSGPSRRCLCLGSVSPPVQGSLRPQGLFCPVRPLLPSACFVWVAPTVFRLGSARCSFGLPFDSCWHKVRLSPTLVSRSPRFTSGASLSLAPDLPSPGPTGMSVVLVFTGGLGTSLTVSVVSFSLRPAPVQQAVLVCFAPHPTTSPQSLSQSAPPWSPTLGCVLPPSCFPPLPPKGRWLDSLGSLVSSARSDSARKPCHLVRLPPL
jgi:hypothetical protein